MEKIGDKDSAIADRVRALLAAANATVGPNALPAPVAAAATPPSTPPRVCGWILEWTRPL